MYTYPRKKVDFFTFYHIFEPQFCETLQAQKYITAQEMKFSITDFFSKCDQICRKLRIWSHLLKKSLMENFIFCAVLQVFLSSFVVSHSL